MVIRVPKIINSTTKSKINFTNDVYFVSGMQKQHTIIQLSKTEWNMVKLLKEFNTVQQSVLVALIETWRNCIISAKEFPYWKWI